MLIRRSLRSLQAAGTTLRRTSKRYLAFEDGEFQVRLISTRQRRTSFDSPARRWEYVKQFELPDQLLPNTWIVVRIDGRGFTKYERRRRTGESPPQAK